MHSSLADERTEIVHACVYALWITSLCIGMIMVVQHSAHVKLFIVINLNIMF